MIVNNEANEDRPMLTSLVQDKEAKKPVEKRAVVKKNTGKNRRKSRELVLKAVYRGMLNQSELGPIFRDMVEDPDYNKADEAYFKQLLEAVTTHVDELDSKLIATTIKAISKNAFIKRPCHDFSALVVSVIFVFP